jgi:tRNA 2-thiocytidine biosynthesis protein TtcA
MTRLHKALLSRMDRAAWQYQMFQDGDSVLAAVSGGVDSMVLLDLLSSQIFTYAADIQLKAIYVDLGFGSAVEERCRAMAEFFNSKNVEFRIERTDIGPYSHSDANRENPCFLCSRIKRRHVFESAEKLGCNRIVFGHHKDDIIETLLLNMIYGREISTMSPKLAVFKGKYHVLRPMVFIDEEMVKKFARERGYVAIDQECPTDGHSKRQYIKEMLKRLDGDVKGAKENIFASMKRVKTDYLL